MKNVLILITILILNSCGKSNNNTSSDKNLFYSVEFNSIECINCLFIGLNKNSIEFTFQNNSNIFNCSDGSFVFRNIDINETINTPTNNNDYNEYNIEYLDNHNLNECLDQDILLKITKKNDNFFEFIINNDIYIMRN